MLTTKMVEVLITDTVRSTKLVAYATLPSGLTAVIAGRPSRGRPGGDGRRCRNAVAITER